MGQGPSVFIAAGVIAAPQHGPPHFDFQYTPGSNTAHG
jgi:hypothetical protein